MGNKKLFVVGIVGFILIVAITIVVRNKKELPRFFADSPTPAKTSITSWAEVDARAAPQAFDIGEITYYRGDKGCCFCSAIAYTYKESGGRDYQQLFEDILTPSYERNMTRLFQQLKKYGLGDRLFFGFSPKNGSETKFKQAFTNLLKNPAEQIKLFSSQEEGVGYLKKVISLGIPVIVAIEDDTADGRSPENEVEDDTFVTVIGYNQQQVKLYWIPDTKSWVGWDEFIRKWKLQNTEFRYELIPGNFSMVFLSP